MDRQETDPVCDCKVGRVLAARELDGLNDRLADRWRRREDSVRDLARQFDLSVLRGATRTAGVDTLEGELENLYRLLTDDDVTSGTRTQARNRLRRAGVDVESVEDDFVSHQTLYTHFRNCLDVTREDDDRNPADAARDRVRSLQNRMEAVTGDAVERLADRDGYDVYVDVSVACPDCGARYEFGEFADARGCDCDRS